MRDDGTYIFKRKRWCWDGMGWDGMGYCISGDITERVQHACDGLNLGLENEGLGGYRQGK